MAKNKKTAVINIKGLNHRDSSLKREDGYCKTLHNMAYRNGSWRGVCELTPLLHITTNPGNYKIVYKHPILNDDEYIACYTPEVEYWKTYFSRIRIINGVVRPVQSLFYVTSVIETSDIRISHYGAVLYFSIKHGGEIYEYSQIFFRGEYVNFDPDQLPPLSTISISTTTITSKYDQEKFPATEIAKVTIIPNPVIPEELTVDEFIPSYQEIYDSYAIQGYITGSVILFAAYKMYDGTIIRNGNAVLLMPVKRTMDQGERLYRIQENNTYSYYMNLHGYTGRLMIGNDEITAAKNVPFIDSIVIYSCKPEDLYDINSVHTLYDSNHPKKGTISVNNKIFEEVRADTLINKENFTLLNKPFYKIAEIDYNNGENSVLLNGLTFRNIEQKELYKPNFSVHNTISAGIFDYNGYLHRFSLKTFLYGGGVHMVESPSLTINNLPYHRNATSTGYDTVFVYTLAIDGRDVRVSTRRPTTYYRRENSPSSESSYIILPNFITYPDSRAYKLTIYISQSPLKNHLLAEFPLKPAYANNYSYYHKADGELVSGYMMIEYGSLIMTLRLPETTKYVLGKNQMVVSDKPNPYSFSPADIYSVGNSFSTEIVDMNIPAEEISDARFGEFPIYLFTTTGIYAMEQGVEDTIYTTSFMINNDSIKSGSRTLVRNGNLFYISENKICALKERTGINLSDIMTGSEGEIDFREYVSGSMIYMHQPYNELIVYNRNYNFAYVFSLEANAWSTRDFAGEPAGGTLLTTGTTLYDLADYEEASLPLPSKVRLEEMRIADDRCKMFEQVRIDYSGQNIDGNLYGQNRGSACKLRRFSNKSYVRRLPGSWKTMTLELSGRIDYFNCLLIDYYIIYDR